LLQGKTPYEVLFGLKPSYEHIKVFGSLCFAQFRPRSKEKFAPCSRKCIFVRYPYGKKGWKLYDLETHEIFVSRHVVFQENIFPFSLTGNDIHAQGNPATIEARDLLGTYDEYEKCKSKCQSS